MNDNLTSGLNKLCSLLFTLCPILELTHEVHRPICHKKHKPIHKQRVVNPFAFQNYVIITIIAIVCVQPQYKKYESIIFIVTITILLSFMVK